MFAFLRSRPTARCDHPKPIRQQHRTLYQDRGHCLQADDAIVQGLRRDYLAPLQLAPDLQPRLAKLKTDDTALTSEPHVKQALKDTSP